MINNILEGIFLKGETKEEVVGGRGLYSFKSDLHVQINVQIMRKTSFAYPAIDKI